MSLANRLAAVAIAAAAVLAPAGAALAGPAIVNTGTSLYAQPGWNRIGYIYGGEWVNVLSCEFGYCFIHKPGNNGFVKAITIDWPAPRWQRGWHHHRW